MALQVFTGGEKPTATKMNAVSRQTVTVCTSSTRPSAPDTGMMIAETDTGRVLVYSGTAWVITGWWSTTGRVGGRWRRAATLAVTASTNTSVTVDTEDADSHGFLTPTSSIITIPAGLDGFYIAALTCRFAADPGSSTTLWARHVRGGSNVIQTTEEGSGSRGNDGTNFFIGMTWSGFMAANDTLEFIHRNAATNGEDITAAWLDLIRVAA